MNVDLPTTGCNILNSATSFYNYSPDTRTRSLYYIYEGKALKSSEAYNQYGYTYTGTCLITGDLVYKPELNFYEQIVATLLAIIIFYVVSVVFLRKWWRVLR